MARQYIDKRDDIFIYMYMNKYDKPHWWCSD